MSSSQLVMLKRLLTHALMLPLIAGITACGQPASRSDYESETTPNTPAASSQLDSAALNPNTDSQNAAIQDTSAASCENAQTQQALNQCAYQAYQSADAALNEAYQSLQTQVSDGGEKALSSARQAWIAYRDLDCNFARQPFEGGSIAPLIYNSCLEDHTNLRVAELQQPALPQMAYAAADAELNQAYQALLEMLSPERQEYIVDTQIAWIEYRDRSCEFEAAYHPAGMSETQCLSRLSEMRTQKIRQMIEQRSL